MIRIDAALAHAMMHDGQPLAVLDLREAGQFGEGHALFAMPLPYSELELRIPALVPRRSERIVLIDAGDDVAQQGAARLERAGYDNLHILSGGMPAWQAQGLGVFKGVNVPSKVLGELAEQVWHPQTLSAAELARWQAEGRPHHLIDARPLAEYAKMRVPGAICVPNGELPHRGLDAEGLPDDVPIVITCAGRTRGIVGAIGLRLTGHAGPVLALENGTQGWALSGQDLERGNAIQPLAAPDHAILQRSRTAATGLTKRLDLPVIDAATARAMLCDPDRQTYLIDVRSLPEVAADPVPGAVHAPGGQLVQATDQWLAVRHARIVLCCDTGLRSALAAFWLRQLGYDPHILLLPEARRIEAIVSQTLGLIRPAEEITASEAMTALSSGARLIDLRGSMSYRAGHVAGASWGIRPHLKELVSRAPDAPVLLIADESGIADIAAADLALMSVPARKVTGGHQALCAAGAVVVSSPDQPADADCIDHLFFVHDRHAGNLDAARRYLEWETGLIGQLSAVERQEFRLIGPERI